MDIRLKFFWIQFSIFESKKIKQFNNFSAIVLLVLSIQFLEGERPPSLYTAKDPKPWGLGSTPPTPTKLKRLPSLDTANNHTIAWEKVKLFLILWTQKFKNRIQNWNFWKQNSKTKKLKKESPAGLPRTFKFGHKMTETTNDFPCDCAFGFKHSVNWRGCLLWIRQITTQSPRKSSDCFRRFCVQIENSTGGHTGLKKTNQRSKLAV